MIAHEVNAAIDDIPSEKKELLDVHAIFGSEEALHDLVVVDYNDIYDQSLKSLPGTPSTKYACGSCASHWVVNAMNEEEGSGVYLNWVDSWAEQLEDNQADVNAGSSMNSWIEFMTEKDVIGSWYIPKTPEEVHIAMGKGHYIWSGSKNIDWSDTRESPNYAKYGTGYGHFFALAMSDKHLEEFTWANSYGEEAYDEGYFHTKREDFDKLMTCVAFVDKQDLSTVQMIENRLEDVIEERGYSAIRQLVKNRRPDLTHAQKLSLRSKLSK